MKQQREEVISVAELARRLARAVSRATTNEWVEGEISSLNRSPSGHYYFSLKDEQEDALLDCVMYRSNVARARKWLVEGERIQVRGVAMVYVPRGRLQLRAEQVRRAGRGALLEALERLKKKLAAEGLFDPARKRSLPEEPRVVGVVTSATGAAFQDICKVAFTRGRVRIVLSPTLVQGETAPQNICTALRRIQRYPAVDVLIVGRGGGSGEDLAAFNDERVVRAVAECSVPVVSAVGHEIDTTLTDLVADVRAATPSQAAELVVPDSFVRRQALQRVGAQLRRAMQARLHEDRAAVDRARSRLEDPRYLIASRQQHVDDLGARLERRVGRALAVRRSALGSLHSRLLARHPRAVLTGARSDLGQLATRLSAAMRARLGEARSRTRESEARLEALSPVAILSRGYAIATRPDGRALRSADEARVGESISIRLHRGVLSAEVVGVRNDGSAGQGRP